MHVLYSEFTTFYSDDTPENTCYTLFMMTPNEYALDIDKAASTFRQK